MNTEMPPCAPPTATRNAKSSRDASHARYDDIIRRAATKLAARLPPCVRIEDLVGCGWVGALEALRRAAPGQPAAQLDAYVAIRARGAMIDHLRSLDSTTRGVRSGARRMQTLVSRFRATHARMPTNDEIAGEMGMDLEQYHRLEHAIDQARVEYFQDGAGDEHDVHLPDASPEESVAKRLLMARVAEAVATLPARLQQVLSLYYADDCTLAEIGAVLGVTESRICQLHSDAIRRVRAAMADT